MRKIGILQRFFIGENEFTGGPGGYFFKKALGKDIERESKDIDIEKRVYKKVGEGRTKHPPGPQERRKRT